jgi:hypothetical protein
MFEIGDEVREGTHVGTVTDVGTVLIQVTTNEGMSRMFCPWELVKLRASGTRDGTRLHATPRSRSWGDRNAALTRDQLGVGAG